MIRQRIPGGKAAKAHIPQEMETLAVFWASSAMAR